MVRGIEFYIFLWIFFMFGVIGFRHLTGKEKWELAKVVWFGAWTAGIILGFLVFIVAIF